jgi:hypothetical protein
VEALVQADEYELGNILGVVVVVDDSARPLPNAAADPASELIERRRVSFARARHERRELGIVAWTGDRDLHRGHVSETV